MVEMVRAADPDEGRLFFLQKILRQPTSTNSIPTNMIPCFCIYIYIEYIYSYVCVDVDRIHRVICCCDI